MKEVKTIRTEAGVFQDLKLLAAINEIPMGEMFERLVRDELARMDRKERNLEIAKTRVVKRRNNKMKRGF